MTLLYATSLLFPSSLANRIQVLAMAEAFREYLGSEFILGIDSAKGTPLPVSVREFGNSSKSWMLAWNYLRFCSKEKITHIYCREERLLFFIVVFNSFIFKLPLTYVYEMHHLKKVNTWWHKFILSKIHLLVCITHAMAKELNERGFYTKEICVAADAVTIPLFDIELSKTEARTKLSLPQDKKIVFYAGSLEEWKGVGTLYKSMLTLDDSYLCVIVGGKPNWVEHFNKSHPEHERVVMLGQKDYHTELPLYLKASDVAVIPNTAKEHISRICTSPLKMFAYMASGVPIVASNLPSLSEVLNDRNAILVNPDDSEALAEGIKKASGPEAVLRAVQARKDVEEYTWLKRAESILSFLRNKG